MNKQNEDGWNTPTVALVIIGLIADFIAIYTFFLPKQIEPGIISSINGLPILLSIVVITYLTYWGALRIYFFEKKKLNKIEEADFLSFYVQNSWNFKTPFLLIPFVLLLGVTTTIAVEYLDLWNIIFLVILILFVFRIPVYRFNKRKREFEKITTEQKAFEENTRQLHNLSLSFNELITEELEKKGFVISFELWNNHPYEHKWFVVLLENYYLSSEKVVSFSRKPIYYPGGFPYFRLANEYGINDINFQINDQYRLNFALELGILYLNTAGVDEVEISNAIDLFVEKIGIKEFYLLVKEGKFFMNKMN